MEHMACFRTDLLLQPRHEGLRLDQAYRAYRASGASGASRRGLGSTGSLLNAEAEEEAIPVQVEEPMVRGITPNSKLAKGFSSKSLRGAGE